jgi:Nucleotide modification associated domain 2
MSDPEPDIYVYKMIADTGGAPCVTDNLLSLAICKPKIRKSAVKESLIFGFGGKEYQERLIYIARVTGKLEGPDYYRKRIYAGRPDCIYRVEEGRAVRKTSARYHVNSDERQKDVCLHFENAFVLLSDDFRYLGKKGTSDYKHRYPNIRTLIENLTQGHRRYLSTELREELLKLKAEIWSQYRRMEVGAPTDDDYTRLCNDESPSAKC